jgi:hypothetical protein
MKMDNGRGFRPGDFSPAAALEDPRIAYRCSSDHYTIASGVMLQSFNIIDSMYIPIAKNWD